MNKKEKIYVDYDGEGDVLEIMIGKPTKGFMKNLGNDTFERIDGKTGEVRGFTILNFKKRVEKSKFLSEALELTKAAV